MILYIEYVEKIGERKVKRFITFISIISLLCVSVAAYASDNILNAVLLEGTDKGYNIILRSDMPAGIKKKVSDAGVLELTVKGVSVASNVSTLYRNVADVNSFVVENYGDKSAKIYIQAPGISKSNVIFETPNASPQPVHNDYTGYKFGAGVGLLVFLAILNKISNKKKETKELTFNMKIKDREMRLLRKYRNEITTIPSINYKVSNSPRYSTNVVGRHPETIRKCEYLNKV